jgi:hypothetical protein
MRGRYFDTVIQRFISRDPIKYEGGGLGMYAAYFLPNQLDPFGLEPCPCDCDRDPTGKITAPDVAPAINAMIQKVIDDAAAKPGATQNSIAIAVNAELISGMGITGIESQLKSGLISGGKQCPEIPFGKFKVGSATVFNIGGECVGSDKLGHFLEEGLNYYKLSVESGLGDAYANAWGEWTEGLIPAGMDSALHTWLTTGTMDMVFAGNVIPGYPIGDMYGTFGDQAANPFTGINTVLDPHGSASPADLSANAGGLEHAHDTATEQSRRQFVRILSLVANGGDDSAGCVVS